MSNEYAASHTRHQDRHLKQRSPSRHHHHHYKNHMKQKSPLSYEQSTYSDTLSNNKVEVPCEQPTKLFLFMSQQLYDSALTRLQHNPTEARTWITSRDSSSDKHIKWSHLPLHLACLQGPSPVPLQFIEVLINVYPDAAQCRNYEGNLPIHLACECMNFSPTYGLQTEGILVTLIKAYPECLSMKDSKGRRPIDILEEKGLCDKRKFNPSAGRGLSIIQYMKMQARGDDGDPPENDAAGDKQRYHHQEKRDDDIKSRKKKSNNNTPTISPEERMVETTDGMELMSMYPNTMAAHRRLNKHPQQQLIEPFSPPPVEQHQQPLPFLPRDISSPNHGQRQLNINPHPHTPQHLSFNPHIDNPESIYGPQSNTSCISPSARAGMDPFHYLGAELGSLRSEHQQMSQMLSIKTQNEQELQERLHQLEIEKEKVKHDFDALNNKHEGTLSELEETTKKLENTNYELKIKNSKEKAVSSELALKLATEEKQTTEIYELHHKLETEKEARIAAVEKLESQMKIRCTLEESMEKIAKLNAEADDRNDKLVTENKELQAQLAQQNEIMYQSQSQVLGLLQQSVPSPGAFDERLTLTAENRQLNHLLQEMKTKDIEMTMVLRRVNDELEISQKENKALQLEVAELQLELSETRESFRKEKTDESSLLLEELSTRNAALQEVALKAIATVGKLQQEKSSSSSVGTSESADLEASLKNAESATSTCTKKRDRVVDVGESIKLLCPMVDDAVNVQKDAIELIQQLLTQSQASMKLTEKIASIDHERFDFESTLKIIEQILSSTVKMTDSLEIMTTSKQYIKSNLVSLLGIQSNDNDTNIKGNNAKDTKVEVSKKIERINAIAHKHLEDLDSLSKVMAGLPKLSKISLDGNMQNVKKQLSQVDNVTTVLNDALSKLVKDARQLKLENLTVI